MKVLMLAPQPYFSNRGTPMNIRTMLSILSEAGVEVDLLTYPVGEDTPMDGLKIHRVLRLPGLRKVAIGPSAAKIVLDAEMLPAAFGMARRGGYSLVHAIEEAVYIGILLKRFFGIPLIYDMDSSLKDQMKNYGFARGSMIRRFFAGMESMAIKKSDGVITVCRALSDIVREEDPKKPVFQIEDIPLCMDNAEEPADADRLLTLMKGRKVFLYTGNFEPYQGLSLLVDAMPAVLEDHPEALFMLVGGSGRYLEEVRDEVARKGIGDSVVLVEPRPPAQMEWFMERAFALLSPRSQGTNTPLKIYTYLQSGRPVVATRMPTHTQVLEDGWAVLVEPESAALAGAMAALMDDPALAEAIGIRGREVVGQRYSREKFREKLLEAYAFISKQGINGLTKDNSDRPLGTGHSPADVSSGGMAAVFLDRDGVINRRLEGDYVKRTSEFHLLPGAAEAIKRIGEMGFLVVVVTNQQGIGRGLMTEEDLAAVHGHMKRELSKEGAEVDAIYYCPHLAEAACHCRKPEPGLLLRAADELGLDLSSSMMVGDSPSDMETARRAGCLPVFLGNEDEIPGKDCLQFPDLISFAAGLPSGSGKDD